MQSKKCNVLCLDVDMMNNKVKTKAHEKRNSKEKEY